MELNRHGTVYSQGTSRLLVAVDLAMLGLPAEAAEHNVTPVLNPAPET